MTRSWYCLAALGLLAILPGCGSDGAIPAAAAVPPGTVELTPEQVRVADLLVDTTRMSRVTLPLTVPGTVVTPDPLTAHLGSIVEGRIEKVDVLPGDRVGAGAALLHIHSHELATAQRDLATAEAQARVARAALDRSTRLLAAEAVSQEEVERRQALVDEAEAELRRSREVVAHLNPSPAGDVVVRAPRAGTIFDVKVRPGEAVVVGTPLLELGDASRLWVTGFIPENAAVAVHPGALISVRFDALPEASVTGTVVRLGGVVDSLRRAVDMRVELSHVPEGIRPGMFASLVLPAAAPADRVVLPAAAVQRTPDGDVVFIADGPGTFHLRAVRAEALSSGEMAVADLPAGLPVVVRGAYALKSALDAPAAGE